tara:strand:+ start:1716 stop:2645 length:930 start_codon:yes stop_codon:yes gene_type:complete
MAIMKAYIIHENEAWTEPLENNLKKLGVEFEDWHVEKAKIDLGKSPPHGVFYNRMSASSHVRGHRYAPEFTSVILNWLKTHNRRVINDEKALALEVSKSLQYMKLNEAGIKTPKSIFCSSKKQIIEAADHFKKPFITKHNRAGRGLGVKLFLNKHELEQYVNDPLFENSVDGITILQDYIEASPKVIHRMEFVNSKFLYTVQVDAGDSFELCPCDSKNNTDIGKSNNPDGNKFMIIKDYKNPDIGKFENFLKNNGIEIAGIEYITDKKGIRYTYDVNTNTNYNSIAENKANIEGMFEIAKFIKKELTKS